MPTNTQGPNCTVLDRFLQGGETHLQDFLGAHPADQDGAKGYLFRVWAPHAREVHLMGDFNGL